MTYQQSRSAAWLDEVRGNDSIRETARRVGVSHATLTRQTRDDMLTFEMVRDIARTYGRPVLQDLIILGFLTQDDVGVNGLERALKMVSEEMLVAEVGRRLGVSSIFDLPISEAIATADASITAERTRHLNAVESSNVGGVDDTDDLDIASQADVEEALMLPHAARRGKRKADQVPFAE